MLDDAIPNTKVVILTGSDEFELKLNEPILTPVELAVTDELLNEAFVATVKPPPTIVIVGPAIVETTVGQP